MRKAISMFVVFILSMLIMACGSTSVSETPMATNESVASLSYISTGFIEGEMSLLEEEDPDTGLPTQLTYLNYDKPGTTTTKVEGEIGYVNIYLDKMKLFMGEGVNSIDIVVQTESDNPDYEIMFTYTVEEVLYTIYYNYDEELDLYEGILILDDITFDLEIEDNLKEEEGETKRNLILTATNNENTIVIDYETKEEEGELKETLEVTKIIDGVESIITIELKEEENSFRVKIQDGNNEYDFKMETDDEGNHYKLDYTVDGIEGTARITETVDDDGNKVYSYRITEGEVTKDVEKVPPGKDKDKENQGNNQ